MHCIATVSISNRRLYWALHHHNPGRWPAEEKTVSFIWCSGIWVLKGCVKEKLNTTNEHWEQIENFFCLSSKGHLCLLSMGNGVREKRCLQIHWRLFPIKGKGKDILNKTCMMLECFLFLRYVSMQLLSL